MQVSIVSTSHTKFGKDNRDIGELKFYACNETLINANADIKMIYAIYISNISSSSQYPFLVVLASKLGLNTEITRAESACASGIWR